MSNPLCKLQQIISIIKCVIKIQKMKKLFFLFLFIPLLGNSQFRQIVKKGTQKIATINSPSIAGVDIAAGLKEALNNGISKQVTQLTLVNGFYGNEAVKILMPPELQKVDALIRNIGLSKLADDGIISLNRAAEDAVKTATPIFVEAIKNMSITDARTILLGSENAATTFLQRGTTAGLYKNFSPIVQQSIGKVGADVAWNKVIKRYNAVPLIEKVNPDLVDYVTQKALEGVFKMIAVEEKNIRTKLDSRTSNLLKQVFVLQDKK